MIDYGRLRNDLIAIGLLAMAVFVGLALVSYDPADPPAHSVFPARMVPVNWCGAAGANLAHGLLFTRGWAAYGLLFALVVVDARLFSRESILDPVVRVVGGVLFLVGLATLVQFIVPDRAAGPLIGAGGYIGTCAAILMREQFSIAGSLILVFAFLVAGLLLTGELRLVRDLASTALFPFTVWTRFGLKEPSVAESRTAFASATAVTTESIETEFDDFLPADQEPLGADGDFEDGPDSLNKVSEAAVPAAAVIPVRAVATATNVPPAEFRHIKVNPPMAAKAFSREPEPSESVSTAPRTYQLPGTDLLEEAEEFPYEALAKKAQLAAATLEKTFSEFGLNVKVVEIDTGPVITQFELELEAGLRLSKVTALADDLAIALRVPSVRVVAPIPGKNTVGVEVPNDIRVMVRLKELVESCQKDFEDKRIPLYLGKDVSGKPLVVDLCKMPHLLIAGRTGTGKSVCLNTLILSMLMSRSPDQVKMLMIDPKMVELSPYSRIPHLMHPVITDMKKAEAVLGWAVDKMEERYDLLARVGVRHLDSYNKLGKAKVLARLDIDPDSEEADLVPETMPYIVIIADEMADMMMTSGKDVEAHIIRLAQKSRAVGIHLVLATQKPTVDVITGLIKSNLPARISFQVASRVDSRVVLDEMGADKLLGNGDMLYLAPGTSNLNRAQGTYVSDEEVNAVIDYFSGQEPEYSAELMQLSVAKKDSKDAGPTGQSRDDLYDAAVEVIIREGRGSVSLLQRALGVGYGRGARLIDYMAEDGIVGGYNGSQAREVVMTMDDWEDLKSRR